MPVNQSSREYEIAVVGDLLLNLSRRNAIYDSTTHPHSNAPDNNTTGEWFREVLQSYTESDDSIGGASQGDIQQTIYLRAWSFIDGRLWLNKTTDGGLTWDGWKQVASSGNILKCLTEAVIQPEGSGPCRIYRNNAPVGTPNVPDEGQIEVFWDWANDGEALEVGTELYVKLFEDVESTPNTLGAILNQANASYIPTAIDWDDLSTAWELNVDVKIDPAPSFNIPLISSNAGVNDNSRLNIIGESGIRAQFGGNSLGVTYQTWSDSDIETALGEPFAFTDGEEHNVRFTYDGNVPGDFSLYIDGTFISTKSMSAPVFDPGGTIDLGFWNRATTDRWFWGSLRNARLIIGGVTQWFYKCDEQGSTTTVVDSGGLGNNATLAATDPSLVWASNSSSGHSGYSVLHAQRIQNPSPARSDCEHLLSGTTPRYISMTISLLSGTACPDGLGLNREFILEQLNDTACTWGLATAAGCTNTFALSVKDATGDLELDLQITRDFGTLEGQWSKIIGKVGDNLANLFPVTLLPADIVSTSAANNAWSNGNFLIDITT